MLVRVLLLFVCLRCGGDWPSLPAAAVRMLVRGGGDDQGAGVLDRLQCVCVCVLQVLAVLVGPEVRVGVLLVRIRCRGGYWRCSQGAGQSAGQFWVLFLCW